MPCLLNAAATAAGALALTVNALAGTTIQETDLFDNRGTPIQRVWLEYRPDGLDPNGFHPVVVVLHPGASTPANIQLASRWDDVADEHGLIVLYPAANSGSAPVPSQWNVWDFDGAPETILPENVRNRDDAGFLDQIIQRTVGRAQFAGDPARVYMTGFSSGAQMTSSYAGTGRTNVAAYAPVSGGWCEPCDVPDEFFTPAAATRLWYWRGETEGGLTPCGVSRDIHDELQRQFWIDFNAVNPTPTQDVRDVIALNPANGQQIQVTHVTDLYTGGNAEFRFTVVLQSGHLYQPGAAKRIWEEFFDGELAPLPCLGDANNDQSVSFSDIAEVLANLGSNGPDFGPGDATGDGAVNFSDITAVLGNLGDQCP